MQQPRTPEPADAIVRALDVVDFGIVLLDRDLNVRFSNPAFASIWRLPTRIPNTHPSYRALLNYGAVNDLFAISSAAREAYLDEREAEVRTGLPVMRRIDLNDGRCVIFRSTPRPDGGFILTYADITEELRQEAEMATKRTSAEARFTSETMESQAAYLATLAEASDENAQRAETSRQLLEAEIAERRQLEAQLRLLATIDDLTGALNRAAAMAAAHHAFEEACKSAQALTVLMLDVDHFKRINDSYGHAGGDQALRLLVPTLRAGIRQVDLIGRLGGEEFLIVLPGMPPKVAGTIANRLCTRMAEATLPFGDQMIAMTISVGVASRQDDDRSVEQVIARADAALYRAKASGRNRVEQDAQPVAA